MENINTNNPGEDKVQEYIARIKAGEDKESILKGLPPSFLKGIEEGLLEKKDKEKQAEIDMGKKEEEILMIPPQYEGFDSDTIEDLWVVPYYIDPEKTKLERERKEKVIDKLRQAELSNEEKINKDIDNFSKIQQARESLGIENKQNKYSLEDVKKLVEEVSRGKKQAVKDLYEQQIKNIDDVKMRSNLYGGLFGQVYNKLRIAEGYSNTENEEEAWAKYLNSTKVPVRNKPAEWMYRGNFPGNGMETKTRGSFNVNITPELIDKLDDMIVSGKISANYKFGAPNTAAAPSERHDSITIYFLETPTEENLKELAEIVKPYVRGNNLLGKKVAEGFFMSEIGSIKSQHIEELVNETKKIDIALAEAIKAYALPRVDSKDHSLKMSEAQYYAIREVAKTFGRNLSYDVDKGFEIK